MLNFENKFVKKFCLADRNLFFSGEVLWTTKYYFITHIIMKHVFDHYYIKTSHSQGSIMYYVRGKC
jgi:hypothetical protein